MQSLVDQCLVEQGNRSHDGSCDSQMTAHTDYDLHYTRI